jgi:3-oxoacyl-[acyl-carrier protein] reductase
VVTGAAMGIGRATAAALADNGADLAICDRDAANLEEAASNAEGLGRRVVRGILDVRDAGAVADFLAEVSSSLGRVDIVVNNAGGGFYSPVLEVSPKGRAALVDENFTSVLHFVHGCVPLMPPSGGSIVNITSIEAFRAAPGFGIYSAMKAAVENLTKTLALELADRRIRVNCVAPDAIPTPGDAGLAEALEGGESEHLASKIPLGTGRPEDVAAAVLYLASDMSVFVTGSTIHVDGGSHAASGWRRGPGGRFVP